MRLARLRMARRTTQAAAANAKGLEAAPTPNEATAERSQLVPLAREEFINQQPTTPRSLALAPTGREGSEGRGRPSTTRWVPITIACIAGALVLTGGCSGLVSRGTPAQNGEFGGASPDGITLVDGPTRAADTSLGEASATGPDGQLPKDAAGDQVQKDAAGDQGAGRADANDAAVPTITVLFDETDELLANPGIGWETFEFDTLNGSVPNSALTDTNLPAWLPSGSAYIRWAWRELEPVEGVINDEIDKALALVQKAGQTLSFRVFTLNTYPPAWQTFTPDWVRARCPGQLVQTGGQSVWVPDWDDACFRTAHASFVKRLGARYNGDNRISHVDIGTFGTAEGEWHMAGMDAIWLTAATEEEAVDSYLTAFPDTPLLLPIGAGDKHAGQDFDPTLRYAADKGVGWRGDCFGDMNYHMNGLYPRLINQWTLKEQWRKGKVGWESCWDLRTWVQNGWSLRRIFDYGLALHGSTLNNKSMPIPATAEVRAEIERFIRRLGYRFVIRKLARPAAVAVGGPLTLAMDWQNVGSAPAYRPYRLAFRLIGSTGIERILIGKNTVESWMPGTVEPFVDPPPELPLGPVVSVTETLTVPGDLTPGSYALSFAIVTPTGTSPALKLAIAGRLADGWYPAGQLELR